MIDERLAAELDRWHAAGKVAPFWLRDDDAVTPSPALDHLLAMTDAQTVPVALAVIPRDTGAPLVERLQKAPGVCVTVHGWSHENHAPAGRKKQELGPDRPREEVLDTLRRGFDTLSALHAGRFAPVLVPPWNRVDAALIPSLPALGFRALSVFGPEKPGDIVSINTHVDVMDWHGTGGGRPAEALVGEIVERLRHQFDHGGAMGLLTHHLVHDTVVWRFLEALFAQTTRHPACRWVALPDLLPTN